MKILIIKPSSLGDIVHANPALVALRAKYFDSKIHWLVFENYAELVEMYPNLNKAVIWEKKKGFAGYLDLIKRIRKEKYDVVIDLQGLLRTGVLSFLSGARERLGVPGLKEMSWLFEKEVYPENKGLNAVYRNIEPVRFLAAEIGNRKEAKGLNLNNEVPKFNINVPKTAVDEAEKVFAENSLTVENKVVGIVPNARGKSKQWPFEYFNRLIELILSENNKNIVIVFGDKNCFKPAVENSRIVNMSGKTSIAVLAAMMSKCRVVAGPDTGPVHLASALGVPAVFVFGGSDVNETSPVSKNASVVKLDYPCSPCRSKPKCVNYECLAKIKPEYVFRSISEWIR